MYRRRYCIHVDRIIKEKTNGAQVPVPIHPSKVQITKLKLDKDAVSRELKLNPLFFMPGTQGFLKINLTIKPRTKTMAVNLDPIPNLGLLRK